MIESLTKIQFDGFRPARNLNLPAVAEEEEWFADEARNVLGVLVRDRIDNDWGYLILGRDEESRFRAVHLDVSIKTRDKACEQLLAAMAEIERSGERVFPQGEGLTKKLDLFTPVVSVEKLNPTFRHLMEPEGYSPAQGILREVFASFPDPDPNFVPEFQTEGFDARIWELYLYAYLSESNFSIERSQAAPDFVCTKFGLKLCIEAVTVNPTQGQDTSTREPGDPPRTAQEIAEKLVDFIPIKFGSPLVSKLRKRYWELDHVAGNPLIFAIADFHEPGSMVWSGSGLPTYLYGYRHEWSKDMGGNLIIKPIPIPTHKFGKKEIPSGFFSLPGAEHVSAVLFSASGTISKFNRMGHLLGHASPRVWMIRAGTRYNHDPNAAEPLAFKYEVGDPAYPESWGQGLSLFHNPRALNPVPPELFPDLGHHWLEDELLHSVLPEFHPFASITIILTPERPKSEPTV